MNETVKPKVISGGVEVFDSSKITGFSKHYDYPIGFEVNFRNDVAGKQFSQNLADSFKNMPKNKALILGFVGSDTDTLRSVTCAFKDVDSFRQTLNVSLKNDLVLFDESENKVMPKIALIDEAKVLTKSLSTVI